ncbi:NAD(P)H-quinone oxidoreductase [Rheinheimera baltica]|uniref:NAD(P)H-quinone oxidoreductase n=1 Tax=Rheinheimera baltica TaxID=67576 RepID=UPI00273E3BD5|nr:NAD(P)H-quinone oxidoreductase [Rheinheimera baltica]MDP5143294.1 NAD(P)H-quinone oxidoreductase [Rheinheimera baltica]MDP5151128.1 NAD(P)H-quinone oxidoreductase [Rheinheimera baltica]
MATIPSTMQAITVVNPGKDSSLAFEQRPVPQPSAEQLLVKVAAAGVNRADLMQRRGLYPPPEGESDVLGLEVAGIVVATGPQHKSWLGKAVFGLVPGGGYAEYAVIQANHAMTVPVGYSMSEAAATAEVFLTAFQLLCSIGNVKAGHRVLIHAGASGVGTAAIQLATALGAHVAATASNDDKLVVCKALGAEVLINYKTTAFEQVLASKWANGLNIILDPVAGEYINREMPLLAMDGKIIIYAMMGGRELPALDLTPLFKRRGQLICSTLRNRSNRYKANLVQAFNHTFAQQLAQRTIQPLLQQDFNWQQVEQAHQLMTANATAGKLVLTF